MIIENCIANLKAGGLIEVFAVPSFTISTKRNIVSAVRDKISNDRRFKRMPQLSMTVEML